MDNYDDLFVTASKIIVIIQLILVLFAKTPEQKTLELTWAVFFAVLATSVEPW